MQATCGGRESSVSGFPEYSPNTVEEAPHSVGSQTCVRKHELNNLSLCYEVHFETIT